MKYLPFLSLLLLSLPLVVFGQQDPGFVPLTSGVPFLENAGNADSLSIFLNDIYKVCIGVAAALAVLQIMRAGIMYMGGDSVTEKKEAKNLIAMSIGGLILVLSPVVVFSIINPEILNLKIEGLSELASDVEDYDVVLPGNEQSACAITYLETKRAVPPESCDALGPDWETASQSCCLVVNGGFCCGRKSQTPEPPQTGPGFRYRIAIMEEKDTYNQDIMRQMSSCVRYEAETEATQVACVGALEAKKISIGSKQYEVIKECAGTEKTRHAYSNLPTCAQ